MTLEHLFGDLVAVPGVQGAILFQQKETPRLYWSEEAEWQSPGERFLRGAGQIVRRLCRTHDRVELRYQRGRFIVQSLGQETAVACFTSRELNLPLLSLTLDEFVQTAQADQTDGEVYHASGSSATQSRPVERMDRQAGLQTEAENLVEEGFVEPLSTHASIAAGLSDISLIASGYLGRSLVNGNWQQTQPAALLPAFHISPDGVIEAENDLAPGDPETIHLAAEWAQAFVAACQLVSIDLPLQLIAPLNADAQAMLSAEGAFGDRGLLLLQHSYLRNLLVGQLQTPAPQLADESEALADAWAGSDSGEWKLEQ